MGACCGGRPYTDNDVENFIRDTIYNFKLKSQTYADVNKAYSAFVEIEKVADEEIHTVDQAKFNSFVSHSYYHSDPSKNAYGRYQFMAIPTFEELGLKAPKYVILTNALSLIYGNDRYRNLTALVETNFKHCDFEHFSQFIFFYLDTNLRVWTEKIINEIKLTKEKVVVENYVIDDHFRKTANDLSIEFSLARIEALSDIVNKELEIILYKNHKNLKVGALRKELVNTEDIENLVEQLPWLFDAFNLRDYYWKHYVIKA